MLREKGIFRIRVNPVPSNLKHSLFNYTKQLFSSIICKNLNGFTGEFCEARGDRFREILKENESFVQTTYFFIISPFRKLQSLAKKKKKPNVFLTGKITTEIARDAVLQLLYSNGLP